MTTQLLAEYEVMAAFINANDVHLIRISHSSTEESHLYTHNIKNITDNMSFFQKIWMRDSDKF